jgi:hypothetical protein
MIFLKREEKKAQRKEVESRNWTVSDSSFRDKRNTRKITTNEFLDFQKAMLPI